MDQVLALQAYQLVLKHFGHGTQEPINGCFTLQVLKPRAVPHYLPTLAPTNMRTLRSKTNPWDKGLVFG